ncbi:MAG: hypothetical protein OCD76_08150 [Reichenbachiella sp.]
MSLRLVILLLFLPNLGHSSTSPCEVLDYTTSITIKEDGKLIITKNIEIQVNSRQGDWITKRTLWYSSKKNRILELEASLFDLKGNTIKTLKKKDIKDRSAIGGFVWYSDDFVKEFQLLHNVYPYKMQYSYTMKYEEYLEVCDWDPYLHYNVPTQHASLELINNSNKVLSIRESDTSIHKVALTPTHNKWSIENSKKLKKETNGPPRYERSSRVIVRPDYFTYGTSGSSLSWQDFGDWSLDLQGNCNDLSTTDQTKFINLVNGLDSDHEKIKTIYNNMQDEVRYIYVGVKYGGLKSYPASYVSENKFGDCKALTTYMQSALAAVGIESYRTTVYAGEKPTEVIDSLPGHQSNHVILCVPLEQDTVWLENTSNIKPYNYLGGFTQNRKALFIKSGESQLVNLPAFDIESVESYRNYELTFSNDNLTGKMTGHLKGSHYDELISFKYHLSKVEQANYLKRKSSSLSNLEIERTDRNAKYITSRADVLFTNLSKSYGPNKVLYIPKSDLIDLEKPENRLSELRIREPENLTDSIFLQIDMQAFTQITLPKDTTLVLDNYPNTRYSLAFSHHNQKVLCLRKFQEPIRSYTSNQDYKDYYQFIDSIKTLERKTSIALRP